MLRQDYRTFRMNIGHQMSEMDRIKEIPLAARICANDASLSVGVGQAGAYSSIVAYEHYGPIVLVLWCALSVETYMCTHIHAHPCIHTVKHACIHASKQAGMHAWMNMCTDAWMIA